MMNLVETLKHSAQTEGISVLVDGCIAECASYAQLYHDAGQIAGALAGIDGDRARGALVHGLRHTFAAALADAGVSVYALMRLARHESMVSSQRYVTAAGTETRTAAAQNRLYGLLGSRSRNSRASRPRFKSRKLSYVRLTPHYSLFSCAATISLVSGLSAFGSFRNQFGTRRIERPILIAACISGGGPRWKARADLGNSGIDFASAFAARCTRTRKRVFDSVHHKHRPATVTRTSTNPSRMSIPQKYRCSANHAGPVLTGRRC
jgi:hypothetical protein